MAPPQLKRVLSLTDVVLFNVVVIFSVRGMTTAAKMGPVSILLWLLAVGTFFVPLGLTVTELATRDPGVGGFYRWTRDAVGDLHGFMGAWFYWVSNLTYLPSLLIFLAGAIGFVIGKPALGNDPVFVASLSLTVLWLTAWLNIRGLSAGKLLTNGGAIASWAAAVMLILAGAVTYSRLGSANSLSPHAFTALSGGTQTLAYFATLTFALVGLELAPVLGGEIKEPVRTLPRAILISALVIAVLDIVGTLAILVALPTAEISPISGALGAVQAVASRAGLGFVGALVAALVAFSVVGGVSAWLGGAARLPLAIGIDHFLPEPMARLHPKHGTPHIAILFQTVLVSVFIIVSQLGSSVAEAYFVLVDLTIILNFIPFIYLFVALPILRPDRPEPGVVRVPGGKGMAWLVGGAGLLATLLSLGSAVIPAPDVANPAVFEAKLWGGLFAFTLSGYIIYRTCRAPATK